MSKFNKNVDNTTLTYEHGKGYKKSAINDILGILFTSLINPKYYESEGQQLKRRCL